MSKTKSQGPSNDFLKLASGREEEALAYQLLSAFGITLEACYAMVMLAIENKDAKIIVLMLTSGVQVRSNVVFIPPTYGDIRKNYPSLVIEGNRSVNDVFNFSALHVCGHMLALMCDDSLCGNISKKAGNCVSGEFFTTNEAGEINKEIFKSWSSDSISNVRLSISNNKTSHNNVLTPIIARIKSTGADFGNRMVAAQKPSAPAVASQKA